MSAYTKLLAAVVLLACGPFLGCGKDMPDPKEPKSDEPTLDGEEPLPEPKELKAGLIITSSPSIEIKIDGKSVGETPLDLNDLEPGEHDVTFMFKGDDRITQTVNLGEGETQKLNQNVSPDGSDAIMGGGK
jgi:hypothetical protein